MNLYQQMLLAATSVSLLIPSVARASDVVNLEEMSSYGRSQKRSSRIDNKTFTNKVSKDIAILKGHVDGLEDKQNDFEAGSFSETTTMEGEAIFTLGAVENSSNIVNEATSFQYAYQLNLVTSFSENDELYVRVKTGNATDVFSNKLNGTYLNSSNGNDDTLKIDKLWYSFGIGDNNTFWIAPKIHSYFMHGASVSMYEPITKQFSHGGYGGAYGASLNSGIGWAYNNDNGFSLSSNLVSKQNNSSRGFLTDESQNNWATQIAYTTDNYHVSFISSLKYNGWRDNYFSTSKGAARPDGNSTNYGLRAYWIPDDETQALPEISVGYDISTVEGQDADTNAYFVGLTWKDTFREDDKIGVALGQPQTAESETVDPFAWETYYSFKVNDSMTLTSGIFGGNDRNGTEGFDVLGAIIESSFAF